MSAAVTWLLPVKNGMPYLVDTLASIARQTCRESQVFVWDNGSTDGSVDEIKRWIPSRLPGIIVTDRPLGLGACLAEMVASTSSEFCARIDADDINFPIRLETQLTYLRDHPEISIVGSQAIEIDESGHAFGRRHSMPLSHDDILHGMLHRAVMYHPTVMFRRQAVLEVGNYRNWDPLIEDYDLWMRLAVKHKLANLDCRLVEYRVHQGGATIQANKKGTLGTASLKCFSMNAPDLFGCSAKEAVILRNGESRFVLPVLVRIARYLCKTQGGSLWTRLSTESWKDAVRKLVNRYDLTTQLFLLGPKALGHRLLRKAQRKIREEIIPHFR
jgi:glycosyltransferase involved in cell wall biosynthesis